MTATAFLLGLSVGLCLMVGRYLAMLHERNDAIVNCLLLEDELEKSELSARYWRDTAAELAEVGEGRRLFTERFASLS